MKINMQNTLLTMAFNGKHYHGYQVQKNAITICEVLQKAIQKVYGEKLDIKGCSRTDSGVHANGYCVNFFASKNIPEKKIPLALNAHLPYDIRVLSAKYVDEDFHARYSSIAKRYVYKIRNSSIASPFTDDFEYRVGYKLDVEKMEYASKHFIGKHDFAGFMSDGSDIEDTVREVYDFTVVKENDLILFTVTANGYLYNMVRIMVGTLIEVGSNRMDRDYIKEILIAKNRKLAGDTISAKGLFLDKVFYGNL